MPPGWPYFEKLMKTSTLFYGILATVALLMAGLVAVQLFWIGNAYRLTEKNLRDQVAGALKQAAARTDEQNFSYFMYGRTYLKPEEGIVVLRPDYRDPGRHDTVPLFNAFPYPDRPDTCWYSTPASFYYQVMLVDVSVRFEYRKAEKAEDAARQNAQLASMGLSNYRNLLDDTRPIGRRIRIGQLDTTIRIALAEAGIHSPYVFGLRRKGYGDYEFLSEPGAAAHLAGSPHTVALFAERAFVRPYELTVFLKEENRVINGSLLWALGASGAIILLLAAAFLYFIWTVLRQKKLSRMKTDFINNMTHEFMTPVTNIGLALETLESGKSFIPQNQLVDVIKAENHHLHDNLQKVLQMAVLEKGSFLLDVQEVDVHDLLCRLGRNFQVAAAARRGTLDVSLDAPQHQVLADETHLANLFTNLLDNAVKYAGNEPPRIQVATGNTDGRLWIRIEDKGIGMPAEVQAHIFEAFYRGAKGNRHDVKGFGLGLAYVQSVAKAHCIRIEVKSAPGRGSVFTLYFGKGR